MWNVVCSGFEVFQLFYFKVYVVPIILFSEYTKYRELKYMKKVNSMQGLF